MPGFVACCSTHLTTFALMQAQPATFLGQAQNNLPLLLGINVSFAVLLFLGFFIERKSESKAEEPIQAHSSDAPDISISVKLPE